MRVGNYTYGGLNVLNCTKNKLIIGSYCSIAKDTAFILGVDHRTTSLSTYPFRKLMLNGGQEAISKGDIIVGDDVWIGYGAIILSGVHIGQGAVIAAGAVVSKDVPPYAIVGGIPAKVIKYRFSETVCKKLEKIDYSEIDTQFVKEHLEEIYDEIDENTDLSWLPIKKFDLCVKEKWNESIKENCFSVDVGGFLECNCLCIGYGGAGKFSTK